MMAEQTVICRHKPTESQEPIIEIQMTVQLERPAAAYPDDGSVEISHLYEPKFPYELQDVLFQRLNNGVHGGYALSNVPYLPDTMLSVKILELRISPSPQSIEDATDKMNIGYLLEVTICDIVDTVLRSMENLRTGQETYDDSKNYEDTWELRKGETVLGVLNVYDQDILWAIADFEPTADFAQYRPLFEATLDTERDDKWYQAIHDLGLRLVREGTNQTASEFVLFVYAGNKAEFRIIFDHLHLRPV